jgi:hypothetical protein
VALALLRREQLPPPTSLPSLFLNCSGGSGGHPAATTFIVPNRTKSKQPNQCLQEPKGHSRWQTTGVAEALARPLNANEDARVKDDQCTMTDDPFTKNLHQNLHECAQTMNQNHTQECARAMTALLPLLPDCRPRMTLRAPATWTSRDTIRRNRA